MHSGTQARNKPRWLERMKILETFGSCQVVLEHGGCDYGTGTHDAIAEGCRRSCEWLLPPHQNAQPVSFNSPHCKWHLHSGCHRMNSFTMSHLCALTPVIPPNAFICSAAHNDCRWIQPCRARSARLIFRSATWTGTAGSRGGWESQTPQAALPDAHEGVVYLSWQAASQTSPADLLSPLGNTNRHPP